MSQLFLNAAEIMLVGMGAVLAFLLLLIAIMSLMAKWIPQPKPAAANPSSNASNSDSSQTVAPNTLAAISAAVHRYRGTHRK